MPFLNFRGFDSTELSSMVRHRYKRTPDFGSYVATDSSFLSPAYGYQSRDWSNATGYPDLDPAYNYIVEVPAAGRTYRIRDIYFDARTEQAGGLTAQVDRCANTVHFTVNDSFYTLTPPMESETFYIVLSK